jgi:chaperone modulatory protein CbpM
MKTLTEVVIAVGRIEQAELIRWVELGWVAPGRSPAAQPEWLFSEVDEARIRMICDLRHDMMVEEDTMPLVLSLLDQVYALRHQMNALTSAVQGQPADVRSAILARLRRSSPRQRR